ncbi:Uncharacterised protein [Vibrio cholerae]|nr:Uncharacterised protein [Vibrio cholerae]
MKLKRAMLSVSWMRLCNGLESRFATQMTTGKQNRSNTIALVI